MRNPFQFRLRALMSAVALSAVLMAVVLFIVTNWEATVEASMRSQCSNNLKQLGLALHNYASAYDGVFPTGTLVNERLRPEKRLSWFVITWGFMDQWSWMFNEEEPWDARENLVTRGGGNDGQPQVVHQVRTLTCPAVRERKNAHMPGWTSYVGIAGIGRDAPTLPRSDPRAGFFGYNRQTRLSDIKDGTAMTMVVVETTERGPWTAGGWPTVRGLDPARQPYLGKGRQFGGTHRGGAMVLFADGSARFVRESIHPRTFEALSTIAGGEKVSGEL